MEIQNLVDTKTAAQILGVSVAFLERARWSGIPAIKYVAVGPRAVRYSLEDLQQYIEDQKRTSTSDPGNDR